MSCQPRYNLFTSVSCTDSWLHSLCFALFLSTLETTIVATGLLTISSDFGRFDLAGWIVLAYLLTYCGFLIIYARLSDVFGRKGAILVALAFFTIFSLLCGVAQSMEQLYVDGRT